MISEEEIYRNADPDEHGFFILMKSKMLVEGKDGYPKAGRCDNLSYAPIVPVMGTEYEGEATCLTGKSPYSNFTLKLENIGVFDVIMDVPPHFHICYMKFVEKIPTGTIPARHIEQDGAPSALWISATMHGLFKNIREWQFVYGPPFNSQHPMAELSSKFFEVMDMPQELIDEIDSYPDSHLARFLQGDQNHRSRVYPFPEMSAAMKAWIGEKIAMYPKVELRDLIN